MCGMKVVVTKTDANGSVDVEDIRLNAEKYSDRLAAIMMTYPSTHGVFEEEWSRSARSSTSSGQVYTDGANMNALVAKPGKWGSDVSHLNLHKTFCIPHGGGGGRRPVRGQGALGAVPPGKLGDNGPVGMVSAASFGSASILPISWMYIAMMGREGLRRPPGRAAQRQLHRQAPGAALQDAYTGRNGLVAHSASSTCAAGRPAHRCRGPAPDRLRLPRPTLSFPVAGTLVEPTGVSRCTSWTASSTP